MAALHSTENFLQVNMWRMRMWLGLLLLIRLMWMLIPVRCGIRNELYAALMSLENSEASSIDRPPVEF